MTASQPSNQSEEWVNLNVRPDLREKIRSITEERGLNYDTYLRQELDLTGETS